MKYCVSDIHGEYDLYMKLLDEIKFSDGDFMYVCGDIIDKGRDSVKLAKYILNMPNAQCIVGNHEYEFLKLYKNLMRNADADFDRVLERLREYFPYDGRLLDWDTVDALDSLPYYIEEKGFICVHAGVPLDGNKRIKPLASVTREELVYDRTFKEVDTVHSDARCVFFGHTPTRYICGEDRILAYRREGRSGNSIEDYYKIHLDTGTWIGGVLGCVCIDSLAASYVKR